MQLRDGTGELQRVLKHSAKTYSYGTGNQLNFRYFFRNASYPRGVCVFVLVFM